MSYAVKEMYYTLQGEGAHAGRAAVFCRFAGCNLWTGREADRAQAVCSFCDTDFVGTDGPGGGKFATPAALADAVASQWPDGAGGTRYVVCTGGEPLLQLDPLLIESFHARGFEVGVETNGTQPAPAGLDWICVSPKAGAPLVLTAGDELSRCQPGTADAGHIRKRQQLSRIGSRDATCRTELHIAERPLPCLEHCRAAGLHRRKELELGVAVFLRRHDLAGGRHAGQQGQPEVAAGLAQ